MDTLIAMDKTRPLAKERKPLTDTIKQKYYGQVRCIVQSFFTNLHEAVKEKPDTVKASELYEMVERVVAVKDEMVSEGREG